jgi:Zn-dependent alcohol dehydrogenase
MRITPDGDVKPFGPSASVHAAFAIVAGEEPKTRVITPRCGACTMCLRRKTDGDNCFNLMGAEHQCTRCQDKFGNSASTITEETYSARQACKSFMCTACAARVPPAAPPTAPPAATPKGNAVC